MPSGVTESVDEMVFAVDLSYSVGQKQLTAFLSECKGVIEMVRPKKIRILYWDTEVSHPHEEYADQELDNFSTTTKPNGGGGTVVECVPAYMKEHNINPQAVIVLTDGWLSGGWGDWSCPVLWCMIDNKDAKPDVGNSVHITAHDLNL